MLAGLRAALYEIPLLLGQGVPLADPAPVVQEEFLSVANSPRFTREFTVRPEGDQYVHVGEQIYRAYRLDPLVPDESHLEENLTYLIMGENGVVQDPEEYYRASFAANWSAQKTELVHLLHDQSLQLEQLEKDTLAPELILAAAPFVSSQLFGILALSPLKGLPSLPEAAQDAVTSAILMEMDHQIRLAHGEGMDSAQAFRGAMHGMLRKSQSELEAIAHDAQTARTYEEIAPLAQRMVNAQTTRHAALTALASYFSDPSPWNFLVEQVVSPAVSGVASVDPEPWIRQWEPFLHVYFADLTQASQLYAQQYLPEHVQAGADRVLGTLKRVRQDSELHAALEQTGIPHLEEDYRSFRRRALSPNANAEDRVSYLLFLSSLPFSTQTTDPVVQARARERYATMPLRDLVRQVDDAFREMLLHPSYTSPQVTALKDMMDMTTAGSLPTLPLPRATHPTTTQEALALYRSSLALADQLLDTVEAQKLSPEQTAHFRSLRRTYRTLEQYRTALPTLDGKYQHDIFGLLR